MKRGASGRRAAFTLLELLIALLIAAIITGIVFSVYRAVSASLTLVDKDARDFRRAVDAVETVGRDITCAVRMPLAGSVYLTLDRETGVDGEGSAVCFNTATRVDRPDELEQFQVERVTYRLLELDPVSQAGQALVRESQTLQPDGTLTAIASEDVISGVQDFHVTVFDGEKWFDTWPVSESTQSIPAAARILLSVQKGAGTDSVETVAIIRAGAKL